MRGKKLTRLNPVEVMARVRKLIVDGTGKTCVTNPDNVESPFYCVEFAGSAPVKSKTMRLEDFELYIHSIDVPSESQIGVLGMHTEAMECLEAVPELAAPFHTVSITDNGVLQCKQDETKEWHAVGSITVRVSYGLLIK